MPLENIKNFDDRTLNKEFAKCCIKNELQKIIYTVESLIRFIDDKHSEIAEYKKKSLYSAISEIDRIISEGEDIKNDNIKS
ncbi:MAG TPA: hypothetical protein PKY81_18060 [bacterium]|nr:hypothetical protein [bacterium]